MPETAPPIALPTPDWGGTGWVILAFDPDDAPPRDVGEVRARLAAAPYALPLGARPVRPLLPTIDLDLLRAYEADLPMPWAPNLRLSECWRVFVPEDAPLRRRLADLCWEPGPVVASWEERAVDRRGPGPNLAGPLAQAQAKGALATLGVTGQGGLWNHPNPPAGADGSQARLLDVELGWRLDHQDLRTATRPAELIYGTNIADAAAFMRSDAERADRLAAVAHGTAVLGLLGALNDGAGVIGVAYGLPRLLVSSWWTPGGCDPSGVFVGAEALLLPLLLGQLRAGDVILLEMQTRGTLHPIETMLDMLVAIGLATAIGVVVVEAAGNAGVDLARVWSDASFRDANGSPRRLGFHMGGGPDAIDSGALVVGACYEQGAQLLRKDDSSFGSRVDLYGPGHLLTTTDSASPTAWRQDFSGTSGASALVAGVVAVIASVRLGEHKARYKAQDWRSALATDPTLTRVVLDGGQPCGRLPRLGPLSQKARK